MSKQTAIIPLSKVSKIQLYINAGKKSLAAIMAETGADYGMNGGLFSGSKSLCNVKADGKVVNDPGWTEYGYAWDDGIDISMDIIPNSKKNYIGCVQLKAGKEPAYQPDMGGKRGRTAMGLAGSSLVLYCTGDGTGDASTPEDLHTELLQKFQCDSALMLDGGGSSQCDFKGKKIAASRVVANLILVYLKKEGDKPVSGEKAPAGAGTAQAVQASDPKGQTLAQGGLTSPKQDKNTGVPRSAKGAFGVVLDAGHGNQSNNQSPDGTYSEPEFALDMAERMRAILFRHGVEVTLTRTGTDNPTGKADTNDLQYRCDVANAIKGLDLFVSLHSNAAGSGWSSARGWEIYASSPGDTAGRNIAAKAIAKRVREAGVTVHGEAVKHERFYVLKNTTAPAVLIEHGFHTNKEDAALLKSADYRKKLAVAQCKGILDYLGIAYDGQDSISADTPAKDTGASAWAQEAWEKAVQKGILDGSAPQGNCTREMLATVLDRLGLI